MKGAAAKLHPYQAKKPKQQAVQPRQLSTGLNTDLAAISVPLAEEAGVRSSQAETGKTLENEFSGVILHQASQGFRVS